MLFPKNLFIKGVPTDDDYVDTNVYKCKPGCKLCDWSGYDQNKA
jgi:hypothetical protein